MNSTILPGKEIMKADLYYEKNGEIYPIVAPPAKPKRADIESVVEDVLASSDYAEIDDTETSSSKAWSSGKVYNEINSHLSELVALGGKGMKYIYVATNGNDSSGDGTSEHPFATIYHANETITDNSITNPYTIIVRQGTYTDLQTKYSGDVSNTLQGVICKDYVYYESENITRPDLCVISWNGATGIESPTGANVFGKCPFHVVTYHNRTDLPDAIHTHIKGFTFDCKNTRYAGHVELQGASEGADIVFENCVFKFGGRDDCATPTSKAGYFSVGCGASCNSNLSFIRCNFICNGTSSTNYAWYIHDNTHVASSTDKYGCTVLLEKCIFNDMTIRTQTSKAYSYDTANVVTVRNCSKPHAYSTVVSSGLTDAFMYVKEGANVSD